MKAFNDFAGFVAGWAVMLDYTVDTALFSLASAGYLSFFFPEVIHGDLLLSFLGLHLVLPFLGLIAASLVVVLLVVNIIGIRESSLFNEVLVSFDLLVEGLILVSGLLLAFTVARFLGQLSVVGNPIAHFNIVYAIPSLGLRVARISFTA